MNIKIDTSKLHAHAMTMSGIGKYTFPNAIRATLNSLAFDVKTVTIEKSASNSFTRRKKNFFKANSRVETAKGSTVSSMKSMVGMVSSGLHNSDTNYAVRDLEQQEHGGTINSKALIPKDEARIGNSHDKMVATGARIETIKKRNTISSLHSQLSGKQASDKQKFMYSVKQANKNDIVIGNLPNRNGAYGVYLVMQPFNKKTKKFKLKKIYTFKHGRTVRIKTATHFMEKASLMSMRNVDRFFRENMLRYMPKQK